MFGSKGALATAIENAKKIGPETKAFRAKLKEKKINPKVFHGHEAPRRKSIVKIWSTRLGTAKRKLAEAQKEREATGEKLIQVHKHIVDLK